MEYQEYQNQIKNNFIVNADSFQISNVSPADYLRTFIEFEFKENLLKDFLVERFKSIDEYCPAGVYYLTHFLSYEIGKHRNRLSLEEAKSITHEPNHNQILEILETFFEDSSFINYQTAKTIFENNGFVSKFVVRNSNSNANACVFQSGYYLAGKLEDTQKSENKSFETSLTDSKIILYDGVIERISEVDRILNFSNQNDQPILIICRKASRDVGYTCALNNKMGKTNVHIFIPNEDFWKEQKEELISLGIFCYGFETGTLLSMIEEEELYSSNISIKDEGIFIKDKDLGVNFEALTTIFISESHLNQTGIISDQLNLYRALLQQISMCGIVENSAFYEKTGIDIQSITGKKANSHPAFPVFRAYQEAKYIQDKIFNIGCLIKEES